MNQRQGSASGSTGPARRKIERFHAELAQRNFFEIFSANKDTPPDKIRQTYKDLAKQWHSDAYAGVDLGSARALLDEIFKRITEAYETLADPSRRAEYLVKLHRQAQGLSTDVNSILRAEQLVDEAILSMKRRQWADADKQLQQAIELNPEDPLYSAHLGWARYNANRKDERIVRTAVDIIVRATKRQENLPIAYQYLGQIHFGREEYAEAKRWWAKCLEWEPKNIDANRGLRLVNQRDAKQKPAGLGGMMKRLLKKK